MNQLPKISIITPSFNQGQFIKQTIDSILEQNYPALEYWVIDGGSTDNTLEILKSYGTKINWLSEKDRGQSDALNKGFSKVTGDVVAWLNSDDYYAHQALWRVGEYFQRNTKAQWLCGGCTIVDSNNKTIQSPIRTYKSLLQTLPTIYMLGFANFITQPSTFFKRELLNKVGRVDESLRYCMDYDLWFRMMCLEPVHILKQELAFFRIHGQSKGGGEFIKQFNEELAVARRYSLPAWIHFLHKIHNQLIVSTYKVIKS